jgi:hypothetical protein
VLPIYTSLNEIYISVTASIVKYDSTTDKASPVVDVDNMAPLAFFPDTLWDSFEIYFNDTLVGCNHKYRHISAHLGRILGFHKSAYETFGGSELGIFTCIFLFCYTLLKNLLSSNLHTHTKKKKKKTIQKANKKNRHIFLFYFVSGYTDDSLNGDDTYTTNKGFAHRKGKSFKI